MHNSKNSVLKKIASVYFILFTIVFFSGCLSETSKIHQEYIDDLDDYFTIKYLEKSKTEGNIEIDNIVLKASANNSSIEALNTIAYLITNNFTNPWWDNGTYFWKNELDGKIKYNHKYFGNIKTGYGYDKHGRLRAFPGTSFYNKPYWIAYMKTGACQELAVLFNETANRAGFETRIVHNPDEDHVWNEIRINETWLYADIDCYHNKNGQNWLGNTSEYRKNCINFSEDSSIYFFPSKDQKDDITINYY